MAETRSGHSGREWIGASGVNPTAGLTAVVVLCQARGDCLARLLPAEAVLPSDQKPLGAARRKAIVCKECLHLGGYGRVGMCSRSV